MDFIKRHGGVVILAAGMVCWAWIVWRSGQGWNPSGIPWNFENTAQLGDSFGVLSSIMAAIAAYFAFRTYQSARDDIARLEQRAAEPSYLNLLERRFDVLDRVRRTQYQRTNLKDLPVRIDINGQQLLDKIVGDVRNFEEKERGGISKYYLEK